MGCDTCRWSDFAMIDTVDQNDDESMMPHRICRRFTTQTGAVNNAKDLNP